MHADCGSRQHHIQDPLYPGRVLWRTEFRTKEEGGTLGYGMLGRQTEAPRQLRPLEPDFEGPGFRMKVGIEGASVQVLTVPHQGSGISVYPGRCFPSRHRDTCRDCSLVQVQLQLPGGLTSLVLRVIGTDCCSDREIREFGAAIGQCDLAIGCLASFFRRMTARVLINGSYFLWHGS
jgi:hypothetical protein